jgi:hypothetical protein
LGSVVMFSLYRPLMEKDQNKIEQILASTEHLVRNIGYISICYMAVLSVVMYFIAKAAGNMYMWPEWWQL